MSFCSRSRGRLINRGWCGSRSRFIRTAFCASAEPVRYACNKSLIRNIVIVGQLGIEITVTCIYIQILCDAVSQSGFPQRSLLGAEGSLAVYIELVSQICLGNNTDLSDIIRFGSK